MVEIRAVARVDTLLAADGAVRLLERISPAFQGVDTSSGALGTATNKAVSELIRMLCEAQAEPAVRAGWVERLVHAVEADGIGFLHEVQDRLDEIAKGQPVGEATPTGVVVSKVFLEFLGPAAQALADDPAAFEQLLKVGQVVWNSVVIADHVGDPKWLAEVRACMAGSPDAHRIETMIEVKRRRFGMHQWLVQDCALFERDGQPRLRVSITSTDQFRTG